MTKLIEKPKLQPQTESFSLMNILTKETTLSTVPNAIRQDNAGMNYRENVLIPSIRCERQQEIFEQEEAPDHRRPISLYQN